MDISVLELAQLSTGHGFSLAEKTALRAASLVLLERTKHQQCHIIGKLYASETDYIIVNVNSGGGIGGGPSSTHGSLQHPGGGTTLLDDTQNYNAYSAYYISMDGGETFTVLQTLLEDHTEAENKSGVQAKKKKKSAASSGTSPVLAASDLNATDLQAYSNQLRAVPWKGDPSYEYEVVHPVTGAPTRLREAQRLAAFIHSYNYTARVVPRGAFTRCIKQTKASERYFSGHTASGGGPDGAPTTTHAAAGLEAAEAQSPSKQGRKAPADGIAVETLTSSDGGSAGKGEGEKGASGAGTGASIRYEVRRNPGFIGLEWTEATAALSSFVHLRHNENTDPTFYDSKHSHSDNIPVAAAAAVAGATPASILAPCPPTNAQKYNRLRKEGMAADTIDFLDPISDDVPLGRSWAIQYHRMEDVIFGRSLWMPGAAFFHRPGDGQCFGYCYMGHGTVCDELPFIV